MFASIRKITTVRYLLRIVVAKKWEVHQMNVHNAFLHGDLEDEVYMKLPQGFSNYDPTKVSSQEIFIRPSSNASMLVC